MNSRRFEARIFTGALGRLLVAAHWRAPTRCLKNFPPPTVRFDFDHR